MVRGAGHRTWTPRIQWVPAPIRTIHSGVEIPACHAHVHTAHPALALRAPRAPQALEFVIRPVGTSANVVGFTQGELTRRIWPMQNRMALALVIHFVCLHKKLDLVGVDAQPREVRPVQFQLRAVGSRGRVEEIPQGELPLPWQAAQVPVAG